MDIDVGASSVDRPFGQTFGYTIVSLDNPVNADGVISLTQVFAETYISRLVVGIFSFVSGKTYQCRDSEHIGDVYAGSVQTFGGLDIVARHIELYGPMPTSTRLELQAKTGDFIGAWWAGGHLKASLSGFTGFMYALGKHIEQGDKADYSLRPDAAVSLYGVGLAQSL